MSRMASVITPPRPQREKWVAWPPERLPTKPNTFLATTSRKSGSIIAVGWDGSEYYAFDARCFRVGASSALRVAPRRSKEPTPRSLLR